MKLTQTTRPTFSTVQFSLVTQSCPTLCDPMNHSTSPTPGAYPNSCPLSRWCHPTTSSSIVPFSSFLQSFPASGSFSNKSALCIRCPKYWSFSFNITPSNEQSGLISLRIHWLDLFAFQGTLKTLLRHHSSKALILRHLAFFIVQLSHSYTTTGETLTRRTFVGKIMSLLFNMLSRFSSVAQLCLTL